MALGAQPDSVVSCRRLHDLHRDAILKLTLGKNVAFLLLFGLLFALAVKMTKMLAGNSFGHRLWFSLQLFISPYTMIELAHTIIVSILISLNYFHIIAALASSVSMFGLWAYLNWIMVAFYGMPDQNHKWDYSSYGIVGLTAIIGLLYAIMMVLAAIGVYKYTKTKKQDRRIQL